MSEFDDAEFDVHEFAEQLGYTDELGRHDMSDPNIERATTKSSRGLSRRDLVVKGGLGAAALTGLGGVAGRASAAPAETGKYTGTLRVITLGVEWPQGAEQQAEKDLGFKFNVQPMSTNAQVQKSITAPDSFDMLGGYNYQFFQIWPTGNFQAVDRTKIKAWNSFYPVFTKGKVLPGRKDCTPGQGNAPYRVLYLDPNRSTGLPLTKEGPRNNKAIVQWWNDACQRGLRRQAPADVDRGAAGPLQHGLDGLQRRRHQEAAGPGLVGRAPQRQAQGPRRRPERPRYRDGRPGQRRPGARADEVQEPGEHEPQRDGSAVQDPLEVQEERALPCVLVDLQRVREPDGLQGGRDRVDVVARRGAPRRPGCELPLRLPEGGHARLVQRPGDPEARHRREARRRRTSTSTGCTRATSAR